MDTIFAANPSTLWSQTPIYMLITDDRNANAESLFFMDIKLYVSTVAGHFFLLPSLIRKYLS